MPNINDQLACSAGLTAKVNQAASAWNMVADIYELVTPLHGGMVSETHYIFDNQPICRNKAYPISTCTAFDGRMRVFH